jgi:hypothetical protein
MLIDLVVLSRDQGLLRREVQQAIRAQLDVRTRLHRVIGTEAPEDSCRWETIARARNLGKRLGRSPWLMFLDDDVVLGPDCLQQLLTELRRRPFPHGAVAADYLGEGRCQTVASHVGMGATLFCRQALDRIDFRWEVDRCECQCCCDDLRAAGLKIEYSSVARAVHLRRPDGDGVHGASARAARGSRANFDAARTATILTAFDRRHYEKFRDRFLSSLRASGNHERVIAFAYGLYPSQQRTLARMRGVDVVALAASSTSHPSRRRLHDFPSAVAQLDPLTPVAHWDAGDVIFQSSLQPLWQAVSGHPDKLLVACEPVVHPQPTQAAWIASIQDPRARDEARRRVEGKPVLQGGFAAATAGTMREYLRAADHLRDSPAMQGSTDWGDQIALNLYCYGNPEKWCQIEEGWSFCLFGRPPGAVRVDGNGRFVSTEGTPVHVVHGNAGSLETNKAFRRLEPRMRHSAREPLAT